MFVCMVGMCTEFVQVLNTCTVCGRYPNGICKVSIRHQYGKPWYPVPDALSWPQQARRLVGAQPPTRDSHQRHERPGGVPHPRIDQTSPYHFGCRPRSTQLAQAPATKTKDLCSANPVLPGSIRITPVSPCVSQTKDRGGSAWGGAAAAPTEMARLLGKILSPHPLPRGRRSRCNAPVFLGAIQGKPCLSSICAVRVWNSNSSCRNCVVF